MKDLSNYILENISDNFIKYSHIDKIKKQESFNTYSYWKKEYDKGKTKNFADILSLDKDTFTDEKFIELYKKHWHDREHWYVSPIDMSVIVICHYCMVKYNKKVLYAAPYKPSVPGMTEEHFLISYVDGDSKKRMGTFAEPCKDNCAFTLNKEVYYYKDSDIKWIGDINSTDEYAKMVLNYIKNIFE